ncbi:hypothetical protein [Marinobacter sp. es.048]|uniref:hypothetical protein n=1 Tax=Marinobacter sp. es.048 TaxID=1761795 RepID=UPI000B597088|nr:hypothetical protein [Marinobacter sp. es.048]
MDHTKALLERWHNGIEWSLLIVEVTQTEFQWLRHSLALFERDQVEDYGDNFLRMLKNFLVSQMAAPCNPQATLHDGWEIEFDREAKEFSQQYKQHQNRVVLVKRLCAAMFDKPSLLMLALERLFLEDVLKPSVYSLRFGVRENSIVSSVESAGLSEFIDIRLWRDLKKSGSEKAVIFGGPISWHAEHLRVPPSKKVVIVQPSKLRKTFHIKDVFEIGPGVSFAIRNPAPSKIIGHEVAVPSVSPVSLLHELATEQVTGEIVGVSSIEETPGKRHGLRSENAEYAIRLRTQDGPEALELGTRHWFLSYKRGLEKIQVDSQDDIPTSGHLVVRNVPVSAELDRTWESEMNAWRTWLKTNMALNPERTRSQFLRAGGQLSHRLDDWARDELVIPQSDSDFEALLICAGVEPVEERRRRIRLARDSHSEARKIGREMSANEHQNLAAIFKDSSNLPSEHRESSSFSFRLNNGSSYRFKKILNVDLDLVIQNKQTA